MRSVFTAGKSVAIVNGIHRMKKYNQHLSGLYAQIGYATEEYQFNPALLFCCHAHGQLDEKIASMVAKHDVIHCQSSSFFRLLPYCVEQGAILKTPIVLESPVLKSHTGTLYAAINWAKSYKDTPQNSVVNAVLDTVCFTPAYKQATLDVVASTLQAGQVLSLTSREDGVCDMEGLEGTHFSHIFERGRHARLFYPPNEQEFGLVEEFLSRRLADDDADDGALKKPLWPYGLFAKRAGSRSVRLVEEFLAGRRN
jgi:hypothetical protein